VGAVGWEFSTPKESLVIGNEIWVSDQLEDAVHRFDLDRNFLGSIIEGPGGQELNNIRGMGFDGSKVYLTAASSPFNDAIITYGPDGNPTGSFGLDSSFSPFDAEPFQGDLLISSSGNDGVERYSIDGAFQSVFAGGLGFPQQVVALSDDSVIVVNSIDSAGIEGLWHYNADGSVREFIDTEPIEEMVPRGGWLLGNGNYLLSTSAGIYTAEDLGTSWGFTLVEGTANGQYISLIPEPAALTLLALAGLMLRRR
jgi:hypothetical protein